MFAKKAKNRMWSGRTFMVRCDGGSGFAIAVASINAKEGRGTFTLLSKLWLCLHKSSQI
jgi:hypothetical protein